MANKKFNKTMLLDPRKRKSRIPMPKDKSRKDPNKKPNTKIFDIIGDILKTPYKIRGGNAEGGMIDKRSSFMGGGIAYKGGGVAMKRKGKK